MSTKLEVLVEVLREIGTEDEEINALILNYFENQNSKEFETSELTYTVLSQREIEDELYEVAENKYFDVIESLEDSAYRGRNTSLALLVLKHISEEDATQAIAEGLDYKEEFCVSLVAEHYPYYIYSVN